MPCTQELVPENLREQHKHIEGSCTGMRLGDISMSESSCGTQHQLPGCLTPHAAIGKATACT